MIYTIESLLTNPGTIKAVIDRLEVQATEADKIQWKDYLTPKQANPDGTFKTFVGTQTAVIVGSIIDKYANKPIRKRHPLAQGFGEVAALGEAYQMDNARLEQLQILIDTYNQRGEKAVAEEIVSFLVDDMRQCYLAPHKRMDLMLADLKYKGEAETESNVDMEGVKIEKITLPVTKLTPASGNQTKFISYLANQIESLRAQGKDIAVLEMSRATFATYIVGCSEFKDTFVSKFGSFEFKSGGLATPAMANDLFAALQIPAVIKIKQEYISKQNGVSANIVPDKKIAMLPNEKLGNLRWKKPYELTDHIPQKTYSERENGLFIATQRTEEGRFVEYGCEWIVEIDKPNRMAIMDLKNFS